MLKFSWKLLYLVFAAPISSVPAASVSAAQIEFGGIYTIGGNRMAPKQNTYGVKEAVFLTGGPRRDKPCDTTGLRNGDYFYQVTDPAGRTLLSADAITDRKVEVLGGVIANYNGNNREKLKVGLRTGICPNAIAVRLTPYKDTPDAHGDYKLWVTNIQDFDYSLKGVFGFVPEKSMTDTFRVAARRR